MRRIIMIGAIAALVVVTAAVIELRRESTEGGGDTREHGEKGKTLVESPFSKKTSAVTATSATTSVSGPTANQPPLQAASEATASDSDLVRPRAQKDHDIDETGGQSSLPPGPDPRSVVGHPFPVSKSVPVGCQQDAQLCRALAQFTDEPRDPAWAPQIEGMLQTLLGSDPQFAMRNLECRTTLCFAEVTSIMGAYIEEGKVNGAPDKLLFFTGLNAFGFEHDPSSARVTVTLVGFSRR